MRWLIGLLGVFLGMSSGYAMETQLSGQVEATYRHFSQEGVSSEQTQIERFLRVTPHYSLFWDHGRKAIDLELALFGSSPDEEKSHFDIREASFVSSVENLEFRLGISKVFWGVTESQHLVDVINQTDLAADFSGDEKLGQPMVNTSYTSEAYGIFSAFVLPYFRERTFPGKKGRLRGPFVVGQKQPHYESEDRERHIDYAFRWSHYVDELEWGLSYFRGIDREPTFQIHESEMIPFYSLMAQVGLDAQYVYDNWLFKLEALKKKPSEEGAYFSSTAGFEYTWYSFWEDADLGLLYEHLNDDRGNTSTTGWDDHSFMATRIGLNDVQDSQVLLGSFFDHTEGRWLMTKFEGSRRITNSWKWRVEGLIFHDVKDDDGLYPLRQDSYWQGSLSYFW